LYVAVTIKVMFESTGFVLIVNGADTVAPAAIVMVAGTVAIDGRSTDRVTTAPAAGAGVLKVTVLLVVEKPPITDVGDRVSAVRVIGVTVSWLMSVEPL
jgi:hypothetical protein